MRKNMTYDRGSDPLIVASKPLSAVDTLPFRIVAAIERSYLILLSARSQTAQQQREHQWTAESVHAQRN
jgi:hypothetical protein